MVPFIFGKFGEPPCVKESFFRRVSVYEPGTIDVNKMLTSLSTIIDRWNETYLNQESSGQVSFKKKLVLCFCKILLKISLIRIIFRSAMTTTSVLCDAFCKFSKIAICSVEVEKENGGQ